MGRARERSVWRREALDGFQPLRRDGRMDDIAEGVLYLADDDRAGFVTGTALTVDGGFAAGRWPGHRDQVWALVRAVVADVAEGAD